MSATTVFALLIVILILDYIVQRVLGALNASRMSEKIPEELVGIYDEDRYKRSQKYLKIKYRFGILTSTFSLVALVLILFLGGFAWLDELVRVYTDNAIIMALLFFGVLGLAADLISTPFNVYNTFHIEQIYGFNKTTAKTFIFDKLKSWVLAAILGGGLLALIMWIYDFSQDYFWLLAWGAITLFSLFMTMFYSNIIVPLFNKQKPLEEGELRNAIEEFAQKAGFKLDNIYVIDGSKRSTKANAYFTGIGPKKRIVLYDTLIEDHTVEELVAVLAHEIGHYKKKHIVQSLIFSTIETGVLLYVFSIMIKAPVLSSALGATEPSFHIGLLSFGILYSPISTLLSIFMNVRSRHNEYEADRFAGEKYNSLALQTALKKLSVNHLSNLRPHPAYVFVHYSHPTLLQRLEALNNIKN